jgi:type I restriction enzyme S subunit
MSSELPIFTLNELCILVADCPHATPKWTDQGVIVLRNQNIKGGKLDLSEPSYTDEEHYLGRIRRAKPQFGDLVITREAPMGDVCQIPEGLKCCLGQRQVLLRPDPQKIESRYLLYALQSPYLQQQIGWSEGTGSTVSNLRIPVLEALKVPTPSLSIQRKVATALGALDDRITLLSETNQTLEAIAQALFKSWFVDFDPVRAKAEGRLPEGMDAATAVLFPDAFEETELGVVPKGWVIGRLTDFAKLKGGKMLSKENFSVDGEFPVYGGAGEMGRSNMSNAVGFVITVGRVGAYCGQYFWHSGKAWVNNNASHVIPHNVNYSVWLYQWLRSVDMDLIKKGAAQPFVSNGDIENLQIILPAASVIEEFVNVCEPLFKRMSFVLSSISNLTNLRDTLLPRLISGQLRIADAEAELEKAIA